jgi:riboflavin kinase/FMN adenylyltransferase
METLRHLSSFRSKPRPIILAAGFFDGVHIGHQEIIRRATDEAARTGGESWVLTFDVHPLKALGKNAPSLLTCNKHKLILLRRYGVHGCILLPFTAEFADTSPEDFLADLLENMPSLKGIMVGENWHFGKGGAGDARFLVGETATRGVEVEVVDPVRHAGDVVSSTRIRSTVTNGDLEGPATMLGRPFSVLGTVSHGRELGRKLGFPTANLVCGNEALPPMGIYAVYAVTERDVFRGVLSFGTRPTLGDGSKDPVLELHILDLNRNLYDKDIEVFFIEKLRDEKRFDSVDELVDNIERDVEKAGEILAGKKLEDWLYTHCFGVL